MLKYLTLAMLFFLQISIYSQSDPNADPNWDWRNGDNPNYPYPASQYTMYVQEGSGVVAEYRGAPLGQANAWDGLDDNKKEDGWVLVARDFGTPDRPVLGGDGINVTPYFILYNKFKSLLRVFILGKASTNFTNGGIIIRFGGTEKTATLTNLRPIAFATDKMDSVKNITATALTNDVADDIWVWGDFAMAYDPTIIPSSSSSCARLTFQVIGTQETNMKIGGSGTGINGNKKNVRDFMSGSSNGTVTITQALPTTAQDQFDFDQIKTTVLGTQTQWTGWKTFLDDMYKKIPQYGEGGYFAGSINNFKYVVGEIKDSWLVEHLPGFGTIAGIVDLFFGGGKKSDHAKTGPTFFGFNLNLTGQATTLYRLPAFATIPVPAAKSNPEVPCLSSYVPLIYNDPVGLVNLTSTPVLQYKIYSQEVDPISHHHRDYWDFRIKDNLDIEINNTAGLVLDSIMAWIVMEVSEKVDTANPTSDDDLNLLASWTQQLNPKLQIESDIDGRIRFRSIPIDANIFKYQTIQGPDGKFISPNIYQTGISPNMYVKLKAVFHRTDDPNAVPIVAISTYEPDFENAGTGNWPAPPAPFTVDITRKFEFEPDEVLPTEYGFTGSDNVVVTVPSSLNGAVFSSWSDGNNNLTRTFTSNTNIDVLYKVVNHSNNTNAFANNDQRKFIRTSNGNLHLVYESMGHVWYEMSTDNGSTWQLMNSGKPINDGDGARSPSIAALNGPGINDVFIAYQENNGGNYKIMLKKLDVSGQEVYNEMVKDVAKDYSEDAAPVISISQPYGNGTKIMIVWRENYYTGFQPGGVYYRYGKEDPYGQFDQWLDYDTKISGTDGDASYPAMTALVSDFYLVWQDNSSIKYCTLSVDAQDNISISSIETPSSGNGYINSKPNIGIYSTGSPVIAWIIEHPITYIHEVQLRIKYNNNNWSQFWKWGYGGGDEIYSENINNNEDGKFVLAWGGDDNDQYITSHSTTNIFDLTTHGDVQVSNAGTDMSDMKINSFDRYSSVKDFTTSAVTKWNL